MATKMESRNTGRRRQQLISGSNRRSSVTTLPPPVRIRTLGRFSVLLHNQALIVTKRRRQRPVQLLQALIALGGREIHIDLLSQALWADADGDDAQNAFDVTLHRLRRLFDVEDLFLLRDRRLTLNSRLAWVDAWAFERLVNHSEQLFKSKPDPAVARRLRRASNRLFSLYQGAFLEREATHSWSLTLRERLRSKFLRHIIDAGQFAEQTDDMHAAIRFYHKGLEIEPLAERLYQRLMFCYSEMRCPAEALAVYHQCRKVLSQQLQISPSARTLELYASIRNLIRSA